MHCTAKRLGFTSYLTTTIGDFSGKFNHFMGTCWGIEWDVHSKPTIWFMWCLKIGTHVEINTCSLIKSWLVVSNIFFSIIYGIILPIDWKIIERTYTETFWSLSEVNELYGNFQSGYGQKLPYYRFQLIKYTFGFPNSFCKMEFPYMSINMICEIMWNMSNSMHCHKYGHI